MSTPVLLLLFGGVTVATFAIFWGMVGLFRRLRPKATSAEEMSLAKRAEAAQPPKDWEGRMDRSFERMVRWSMLDVTTGQALGAIVITGALLGAALFFLTGEWWLTGLGLLLGMVAPLTLFMALQGRWLREVRDQLPEGIFLLARSLRAGLSLEQAFASGRNFCPRPLIEVFGRIADQIELGRPAATAVQQMADSIVLPDLNTLASVLVLHNEVGGNLPVLLDRLAANIRDHNQFRGYYRAATTLSRVSAAFIAIAAPVLGLLLFLEQPELFLNFFRTGMGIFLFALAIIINLVGIVWLYLLLGRVQY